MASNLSHSLNDASCAGSDKDAAASGQARAESRAGGGPQQQQDACLKAVNPVKLKKSGSNKSSGWGDGSNTNSRHPGELPPHKNSKRGVFESVPFTPSQGVSRTSSNSQYNFDPYWGWGYSGRESPNPMLRGASDAGDHAAAFPSHMTFPPFMLAYSMAFSTGAEANSPQYPPPSPLMGSPVGTPTAMMFPQTPFAGTHHSFSPFPARSGSHNFSAPSPSRSPSFPEPFSPMSPNKYGYFHPMFNNFPAFLIPPQCNSSSGTSPRKAPGGNGGAGGGWYAAGAAATGGGGSMHPKPQQPQQSQQQQQQQPQQPQPQQRPDRANDELGDGTAIFDYAVGGMNVVWPPPGQPVEPAGPGVWGAQFPQFPPSYAYPPPNGPMPSRAPSGSLTPYGMPMHLLQPLFAMSSMGSGGCGASWPPLPPSPPPAGKGRTSSSNPCPGSVHPAAPLQGASAAGPPAAIGTHPTGSSASLAAHTLPTASSRSSTCSTVSSTPAHSPPNQGAGSMGSSQEGGVGGIGHKGKPRPPPLQLHVLHGGFAKGGDGSSTTSILAADAGSSGAGACGGVAGPSAGAGGGGGGALGPSAPSGTGPMLFPPNGQHGPAMHAQGPGMWGDSPPASTAIPSFAPPLPPHPFAGSGGSAPPMPGPPPPFMPLPNPFGLGPGPFMPMPMPFLPHMLHGSGMPLMAHMLPPGLHGLVPSGFPPCMSVPAPPHGHPYVHPGPRMSGPGHNNHPGSPYAHSGHHAHHGHPAPPNSCSMGRRPQQQGGLQQQMTGTQGCAAGGGGGSGGSSGAAKVDTPPRLNARQRRTLRRAKERAIKGLMDAGHLALKQQHGEGQWKAPAHGSSKEERSSEDLSGSDTDDALRVAAQVDDATASYYMSAAMSVVAGAHGPEAAASASQAINKVAADLDDVDLTSLISHLAQQRGKAGKLGLGAPPHPAAEEGLLRDLQIIQNLIGLLKVQGEGRCADAGAGVGEAAEGHEDGCKGEGKGVAGQGPGERGPGPQTQPQPPQPQPQWQGRPAGRQQQGQQGQQQQGQGRRAGRQHGLPPLPQQLHGHAGHPAAAQGRPKDGGGGAHGPSATVHVRAVC